MREEPEHLSWRRLRCSLPIGWRSREVSEHSVAVVRIEDSENPLLETVLLLAGATEHRPPSGHSVRDFTAAITFRRTRVTLPIEPDRIGGLDALRVDWTDGINDIVSWFVSLDDHCYEVSASSRALPESAGSAEGLGKFVFAYLRIAAESV